MLSACLGRDITSEELKKRGVRLSVPTLFKAAFKNSKLRANFDLKAKWHSNIDYDVSVSAGVASEELAFFSEYLSLNGTKIMGRSPHGISVPGIEESFQARESEIKNTRGIWDGFQHLLRDPSKLELQGEIQKISDFVIYSPQTAFLRGTELENTTIKPLGLSGGDLPKATSTVFKLINKKSPPELAERYSDVLSLVWAPGWTNRLTVSQISPDIVSTQVRAAEQALYFFDKHMNLQRNKLSAYDSSEGTLYLLFMVVLLLHPEAPKIFAVDNIDNALNPKITRKLLETVIRVVCKKTADNIQIGPEQVFLTSHNPTSLDAFDLFDNDQRVFVVTRDTEDGSTKITRLKPTDGMTKADWIRNAGGKNLSELWIEGKIKGALGL